MKHLLTDRALTGVALLLAASFAIAPVQAAPADYRFEMVQMQPAGPGKNTVTVRLVHVPDSKPVTDAVIFASTANMGPSGMPSMTAPVKTVPPAKPGLYSFEITPDMAGNWELQVSAKVQGETGTVTGKLPVKLVK